MKMLILRLTKRCNLACEYCYAQATCMEDKNSDMSLETAKKAILTWYEDSMGLQFTGGEPLLCADLIAQIYEFCYSMGFHIRYAIQTNGTLLNDKNCELLKRMNCGIGVSLDGVKQANALRHDRNQRPSFYEVIQGIQNLRNHQMGCNLNVVVTKQNVSALDRLAELCAYLGNVYGIGLDMFRPLGNGMGKDFEPKETELCEAIRRLILKKEELNALGVPLVIKEYSKVLHFLSNEPMIDCYCHAQTGQSVAVDYRERIYPCSSLVDEDSLCMGTIDHPGNLCKALNILPKECHSCKDKLLCRGGCPAGRLSNGGYSKTDCMMHKTMIELGRKAYEKISLSH